MRFRLSQPPFSRLQRNIFTLQTQQALSVNHLIPHWACHPTPNNCNRIISSHPVSYASWDGIGSITSVSNTAPSACARADARRWHATANRKRMWFHRLRLGSRLRLLCLTRLSFRLSYSRRGGNSDGVGRLIRGEGRLSIGVFDGDRIWQRSFCWGCRHRVTRCGWRGCRIGLFHRWASGSWVPSSRRLSKCPTFKPSLIMPTLEFSPFTRVTPPSLHSNCSNILPRFLRIS